ncbi:MAG: c-type cytochrome [Methyloceanibacter sp.]|nr:c-type cytochrome [Methyloceanibacter sp.]
MRNIITAIFAIVLVAGMGTVAWNASATEEPAKTEEAAPAAAAGAAGGECCKAGDTTPPLDLIKATPKGGLHNPYNDQIDAIGALGQKTYLSAGCNGCHGGGGGGGMCPPLTNDTWVYGADDDVVFRLIALGTDGLVKEGPYKRLRSEIVVGPMPPFGNIVKTSDDMWKIISFLRLKNPSSLAKANQPAQ